MTEEEFGEREAEMFVEMYPRFLTAIDSILRHPEWRFTPDPED
jgi:hypothetical protein